MTEPGSLGVLLHRLFVLLSWKYNSTLAWGQEKVSSLSTLTGPMFFEASEITSPKETATALKAACSHRPWIVRNSRVIHALPFDIHDLNCALSPYSLSQERKLRREEQTVLSVTWFLPISPHLFGCEHAEIVLSSLMDELFFSWWKAAVHIHILNCIPHQKFMKLCHAQKT